MKYTKPPLSFEQQADLLLKRGMQGDRSFMIERLQSVNYYRLSGYWYPLRLLNEDRFKPWVSFEMVWNRYVFDRHLRLVVMDAIERIEIAVRTNIAFYHAHDYSPFAYAEDPLSLPKLKPEGWENFQQRILEETKRSKDTFVKHFNKKYGDCHDHLPVWMIIEVMTFGTVLTFFCNASHKLKRNVASIFGLPSTVFENWLLTLNMIRNICAHHGRLWNRELGVKPFIPKYDQYPEWHEPVKIRNNRTFVILTICQYCLSIIAPQSRRAFRLDDLLNKQSEIPLKSMGFPDDWKENQIWKNAFSHEKNT